MANQFGLKNVNETRIEILRVLKDGKIRELHEIAEKVAKRTNAKNTTKGYSPEKKQHDSKWLKKIKFDISWLQFILLDKGRGKLSDKEFNGKPLLIKKIPSSKHPDSAIRNIDDKSKAYFQITTLGKEILKFFESVKT
mgnify:CR=1 FL=1